MRLLGVLPQGFELKQQCVLGTVTVCCPPSAFLDPVVYQILLRLKFVLLAFL